MAVIYLTSEMLYRMHRLKREMAAKKRRSRWIYPAAFVLAWWILH